MTALPAKASTNEELNARNNEQQREYAILEQKYFTMLRARDACEEQFQAKVKEIAEWMNKVDRVTREKDRLQRKCDLHQDQIMRAWKRSTSTQDRNTTLVKNVKHLTSKLVDAANNYADQAKLFHKLVDAQIAREQRDNDWIFAIADAVGLNSGYNIPIVPTTKAFKDFFATFNSERDEARMDLANSQMDVAMLDKYRDWHADLERKVKELKEQIASRSEHAN